MRTIDVIRAEMKALIEGVQERNMTDDEVTSYEALETELRQAEKTAEIMKRASTVSLPSVVYTSNGPAEDKTLERAFADWAKTGHENDDITELRAQSTGTASEGGYLVPTTLLNRLTDRMKAFGGIESVAETMNTDNGNTVNWPTLDDTANTGAVTAENAAPASGGADLVFGTKSFGVFKYTSTGASNAPVKIPSELLADAAFDVESLVLNKLALRLARVVAPLFYNGNGTTAPQGLVTGCTVGNGRAIEIADDTLGLTYDDLITFEHSIDPAYREMGATWLMNDASLAMVKKMKDSAGDPLFLPATGDRMSGGVFSGTLLGYPVRVDQAFANFSAASNTTLWGAFGNFREGYIVRNAGQVVVFRNPYLYAEADQVGFHANRRVGAIQNQASAYVALTGEA